MYCHGHSVNHVDILNENKGERVFQLLVVCGTTCDSLSSCVMVHFYVYHFKWQLDCKFGTDDGRSLLILLRFCIWSLYLWIIWLPKKIPILLSNFTAILKRLSFVSLLLSLWLPSSTLLVIMSAMDKYQHCFLFSIFHFYYYFCLC